MSFLTSQPDLSGTIFTKENLLGARKYFSAQLEQEDRAWLDNPQGPIREYWGRDDNYAVCFLIDFAITIFRVASNITKRSYPLLAAKIKEGLLRAGSEKEFLENYTEFQVASVLIEHASPLSLEPLVPEEKLFAPDRPPSPDFALRLPDGDVCLEATVCHIDALEQWDKSVEYIKTKIEKQFVFKGLLSLSVNILLPLKCTIDTDLIDKLLNTMDTSYSGSFPVGSNGMIQWEPLPHTAVANPVFSIRWGIAPLSEEEDEILVTSFRNTINRKHKQFPDNVPAILVLRLGDYRLVANSVIEMLRQRFWLNDEVYDWLTGICLFIPRQGFGQSDVGHHLELCPNPNARCKASDSLISLFNGTAQFHLNL